jgi:hypothetical protein
MTAVMHEIDLAAALSRAGVEARIQSGSAVAFVYLADARDLSRAEAALRNIPGHAVHLAAEVPAALRLRRPGRTGDLVLLAEPPYFYTRSGSLEAMVDRLMRWLGRGRGAHGYLPTHPDMSGIFYAMGRGIASDLELGAVSNLDLAPTVSALLGIDAPKDCEGSALRDVGEGLDERR